MSTLSFLKEGLKNLRTTGTITRSGSALCEAVIEKIDFKTARVIVEFGAGDGVVTKHILNRLHPDGIVFAFEVFEELCAEIEAIGDPRLVVINDSAEKIGEYLKKAGHSETDYIVSALPFANIPPAVGKRIVASSKAHLKQGGVFSQIHYSLKTKAYYQQAFGKVEVKRIWQNLPPAWVLHCG